MPCFCHAISRCIFDKNYVTFVLLFFFTLLQSIRKAAKKRMDLRFDELCNNSKLVSPSKKIDTSFALYQGTYNDNYCTLEQIGSGAFGCVKNGFRRSDKKMVNYISILKILVIFKVKTPF